VAAGASALLDTAVTLVLLVILMVSYAVVPSASVWLAAPALLGVLLLSFGLTAFLSALNARWRDVQHTLPFLLQIGLFVTPVIYQTTFVPPAWRWVLALNPLTGLIEVFRAAMVGTPMPAPRILVGSLAASIAVIAGGLWYFARSEATIVDVV
jgi:lipopolysaccharide transport system permease protein